MNDQAYKSSKFFNDSVNIQNDDLVLIEPPDTSEFPLSLDYTDYNTGNPIINRDCNIALEQQSGDVIIYQEGITGSGFFDPGIDSQNNDGTYKRLVHSQTKAAFYNKYQNPTRMFGMDYIDFPLSKTDRQLSDVFRIFNIPRRFFGERLVEKSIHLYDTSLDDNVEIHDDGYQNLIAGENLFSKVQEVREFTNIIIEETSDNGCFIPIVSSPVSANETSSLRMSFLFGDIVNYKMTEVISTSNISFYSGSTFSVIITASKGEPFGESSVAFYTGSVQDVILVRSGSDSGPNEASVGFYTGSLQDVILIRSGSDLGPNEVSMGFWTGSVITWVFQTGGEDSGEASVGFYSGSIT